MTHSERVPCPICGSSDAVPVRRAADICQCQSCAVVYLRSRPKTEDLEKWYQSYASNPGSHMAVPKTVGDAEKSGLKRDYFLNEVMEFTGVVSPLAPTGNRMLDIGSGWGAFLLNAKSRGWRVQGVEICKQMAEYATHNLGILTFQGQLEAMTCNDRWFRVVTAIHTLEHLPNQRTALQFIHRILEDDGLFCGIVPNFGSFCSERMGDAWPWLDHNFHYVHWTPPTLVSTLRDFGFHCLRIYTDADDFYPDILAAQIAKKWSGGDIESIKKTLGQTGQGEAIRFFARKL